MDGVVLWEQRVLPEGSGHFELHEPSGVQQVGDALEEMHTDLILRPCFSHLVHVGFVVMGSYVKLCEFHESYSVQT